MALCDNYRAEIEATIGFVDKNLKDHGVVHEYHGKAKGVAKRECDSEL